MCKTFPTVSEMERMSSEALCKNFDVVLDRICEEDTAIIIEHKEKDFILCPAYWFTPTKEEINTLVVTTAKYILTLRDSEEAQYIAVRDSIPFLTEESLMYLIALIEERQDFSSEIVELRTMLEKRLKEIAPERQPFPR